jgi:hypothetical protein
VTRFLEATRERFLVAIAASLPAERFIQLHFFSPIRQGGVESGVAVIAAYPERTEEIIVADAPPEEQDDDIASEAKDLLDSLAELDSARQGVAPEVDELDPSSLPLHRMTGEGDKPARYTVYVAKYRLVLKGPDRGKWECTVVAEADAPLVTVETVVRGVQRRSGDTEEPERMSGDDARDYLLAAAR